jgi:hypothetical protein
MGSSLDATIKSIALNYCESPGGFVVTDHLHSNGGEGGPPGDGGASGLRGFVFHSSQRGPSGTQGPPGDFGGTRRQDLIPEVEKVDSKEFWENVIIELGIPTG